MRRIRIPQSGCFAWCASAAIVASGSWTGIVATPAPAAGARLALQDGRGSSSVTWLRTAGEIDTPDGLLRYQFLAESREAIKKGSHSDRPALGTMLLHGRILELLIGWRSFAEDRSTAFADGASLRPQLAGPPLERRLPLAFLGRSGLGGVVGSRSSAGIYLGGSGADLFALWLPGEKLAALYYQNRPALPGFLLDASLEDGYWQGYARIGSADRSPQRSNDETAPVHWRWQLEAERRNSWDRNAENQLRPGKSGGGVAALDCGERWQLLAAGIDRSALQMRILRSQFWLHSLAEDGWSIGLRVGALRWRDLDAPESWSGRSASGGPLLHWRNGALQLQLGIEAARQRQARGELEIAWRRRNWHIRARLALASASAAPMDFLILQKGSGAFSSIAYYPQARAVLSIEAGMDGWAMEWNAQEQNDRRSYEARLATELQF
ncbi:MAG: hypothetical protein K1X75_08100 [Leptospirales bacterium]|nr:hypothetical protein [Leptospirales bacterium]